MGYRRIVPRHPTSSGESPTFAGFVATPSGGDKYEMAQVSVVVPTVTCTNPNVQQVLFVLEYLEVTQTRVTAFVSADCVNGTPYYDLGCNVHHRGGGSSQGVNEEVSPGDSVTLTVLANSGDDGLLSAGEVDNTSGLDLHPCEEVGGYLPPPEGTVYTGICSWTEGVSREPGSEPDFACRAGQTPEFSPVSFTEARIGNKVRKGRPLDHWNPQMYKMVSGTTVQVTKSPLGDDGQSFTDTFVNN